MKTFLKNGIGLLVIILVSFSVVRAQEDAENCKDHPFLSRMPGHYIYSCSSIDWDAVDFSDEKGDLVKVEGKVFTIEYSLKEGQKERSPLQIIRNYENSVKKIGGKVIYTDLESGWSYLQFERDGKKISVVLYAEWGGYSLTFVEQTAMAQEVVADPKALANNISTKGHASVYGIYFDVDSDVIKSGSEPALKAISDMLKANPNLRVYIVGHTDMTGSFEHNINLSLRRAKSVVKALVNKYGISPRRLKAQGIGPLAPVSTNRTEDGKKRNRRVVLVEML